jgi:transcriptional regulator with GAF, ATPase, and Fis domain
MGAVITAGLAKLVEEGLKTPDALSVENIEKYAAELAKGFQVKADEIAILVLRHNGAVLSFLHPTKLQKVGSVPMTSTASLAVRTVREKRPEMINNFPAQKHPTIFEAVELNPETKGNPIQKIMSAPLISEGKAIGVIQISRKGKTGPAAGADFTIKDLTALMTAAGVLAKVFKAAKP